MNVYAVIILSTLLLDYILNLWLIAATCGRSGTSCRRSLLTSTTPRLSEIAGVYTCADPFWHTDVNVYAGCDPGILVRGRLSDIRRVGT